MAPDSTKATQLRTASPGNHLKILCAQAAPELETRPRSDGPATKGETMISVSRDNGPATLINAFSCEPAAPDVHT